MEILACQDKEIQFYSENVLIELFQDIDDCIDQIVLVAQSSLTLRSHGVEPIRLLCPLNSPGQNTEVGCIPFSRVSSRPRDRTQISHIASRFFTTEPPGKPFSHWSTREVPLGRPLMLPDGLTCQAAAVVMPEGARDESSENVRHLPA